MSKQGQDGLTFGQWLTAQMKACEFATDLALAEVTGVHGSTIGRWRRDRMVPDIDQLQLLEKPLKTPVTQMAVRAGHLSEDQARVRRTAAVAPTQPVGRVVDPALMRTLEDMTPDELLRVRQYAEFIHSQNPDA